MATYDFNGYAVEEGEAGNWPPVNKRKPGHNPGLVTHGALENGVRRTRYQFTRMPGGGQSPVLGTWRKNSKQQHPSTRENPNIKFQGRKEAHGDEQHALVLA
jgi:hypothetical protein